MPSLVESNPYLRDAQARREMLELNARQSSMFEGARNLQVLKHQTRKRRIRPSIASAKKSAKKP